MQVTQVIPYKNSAIDASYVICSFAGIVYAQDGKTGGILTSNVDFTTVVQAAIAALTNGRTWKEKISIVGDYEARNSIVVPDYTVIGITGNIKAADGFSTGGIFENSDTVGGNVEIEICGSGTIDGNFANQPSNFIVGIALDNVDGIKIHGLEIVDIKDEGIGLRNSSNFQIYATKIHGCGDDCVSIIHNTHSGSVTNNIFYDGRSDPPATSGAVEVEDGAHDVVVANNVAYTTRGELMRGYTVVLDAGSGYGAPYNITIADNIARNLTGNGIFVQSAVNTKNIERVKIRGNQIYLTARSGIYCAGINSALVQDLEVTGNTVYGVSAINQYGMFFQVVNGTSISNNAVSYCEDEGVRIQSCGRIRFGAGNRIWNNGQDSGSYGLRITGVACLNIDVINNYIGDTQGSKTQSGIFVFDANNNINVRENDLSEVTGNVIQTGGAGAIADISRNVGYLTEAVGSATIANGTTSIVVTHGLAITPDVRKIVLMASSGLGSAKTLWVAGVNATQFTIWCNVNPGADKLIYWSYKN